MPKHEAMQNQLEPQQLKEEEQADEELHQPDRQAEEVLFDIHAKDDEQLQQPEYKAHLANFSKNLARIQTHEEKIERIRNNYGSIISKIAENPSNLTKLAKAYSSMHMAAKVGTGALVSVSPFTLLVFIGAAAAVTSAVGILAAYTTIGLLLDEHTNASKPEQLEEGINEVVGVLEDTVRIFDDISLEFSAGVDGLNKEVDRLRVVITGLNALVDQLNGSIGDLSGEVSSLKKELTVMQTVSAQFEEEAAKFKEENEVLKTNSMQLQEANKRFCELNDQYLDKNYQQDQIIAQHKELLEQYTYSQKRLEEKLKEVKEELAIRQAGFEALFEAQMAQQNLSSEQIQAQTKKFTTDLDRINQAAKIEFKGLQAQISTSSAQLLKSQEVQERLQTELSQSVEKLAVREREFKALKDEYSIEIEKLKQQITILTSHNQSLGDDKDKVYLGLAEAHATGKRFKNLFWNRDSVPVATPINEISEDKSVNSRWNSQITI